MLIEQIKQIAKAIQNHWPFDQNHYPELKDKSKNEVTKFALHHMTLHVCKEGGTMARIHERAQHRPKWSLPFREKNRLKKLAMKVIVSGFRLFHVTGGSPEELERYINKQK